MPASRAATSVATPPSESSASGRGLLCPEMSGWRATLSTAPLYHTTPASSTSRSSQVIFTGKTTGPALSAFDHRNFHARWIATLPWVMMDLSHQPRMLDVLMASALRFSESAWKSGAPHPMWLPDGAQGDDEVIPCRGTSKEETSPPKSASDAVA